MRPPIQFELIRTVETWSCPDDHRADQTRPRQHLRPRTDHKGLGEPALDPGPRGHLDLPGDNAISGIAAGADEVIARATLIAGYGLNFALEHVLVSRDNMALALHNTATWQDIVLDEYLSTVCTIDDGRIVAIETYLSDVDGMNAFFTDRP